MIQKLYIRVQCLGASTPNEDNILAPRCSNIKWLFLDNWDFNNLLKEGGGGGLLHHQPTTLPLLRLCQFTSPELRRLRG